MKSFSSASFSTKDAKCILDYQYQYNVTTGRSTCSRNEDIDRQFHHQKQEDHDDVETMPELLLLHYALYRPENEKIFYFFIFCSVAKQYFCVQNI